MIAEKELELWHELAQKVGMKHLSTKKAFLRQLELYSNSPTGSSCQIAGRSPSTLPWSEVISTYRFMDNENISLKALRSFRRELSLAHHPKGSDVLVMNDISLLDYYHHTTKEDRRAIGDGKGKGYEYVCNLAVNPSDGGVLGVLHDCLVNCDGPDDVDMVDYSDSYLKKYLSTDDLEEIKENHKHQMVSHIRASAEHLKEWNPIHVGDREFDDIFIMLATMDKNHDFVLRAKSIRNVQTPNFDALPESALVKKQGGHPMKDGYVCTKISELIKYIPLSPYKELPLDGRGRVTEQINAKRNAQLHIGSVPISLYRQAKRNHKYIKTPQAVDVNLVVIKELNPPEGEEPLLWILFTNRDVDTLEKMTYIGKIYELRWKIEEFFRLLKTTYKLEQARYNSASKVARYLVLITIAAQMTMKLRSLAGISQSASLDDEEYHKVKEAMKHPNDDKIDINLRLFALIARRGGWLGRRRDPIGSTILSRGMMDVLTVLQFQQEHKDLLNELQNNPQNIF
ncbi:transposase [Lentisphaera profundi]|uniref:Transposase n=3 Tax=Lentisphaera profundi TaxID=1658616 RepID=A0ABY7W1K1_9BACT|nr:transposase [Lentisphaera profundi]WDE96821.1 transposase [Lentisphaera profundi]WDE96972.1 transposase [Lentisphaera profundi]WDE98982.1 transposase [Lentisphaera profundi]WDE99406.1 transposase [Lentisphaera profundi]